MSFRSRLLGLKNHMAPVLEKVTPSLETVVTASAGLAATALAGSLSDGIEPVGVVATTALAAGALATADHFPVKNLTSTQKAAYAGLIVAAIPVLEKTVHFNDGLANILSNEYVRESIMHAPVHALTAGAAIVAIAGTKKLIADYGLPRFRRAFAASAGAIGFSLALATAPELPESQARVNGFALSYIDTAVQGKPAADREDVGRLLGPEVKADLQLAVDESGTKLIYPLKRAAVNDAAQKVADVQNNIFKANSRNTVATVLPYDREESLYRVSFGTGSEASLKKQLPRLERRLGKGRLSIEQLDNNSYVIVERQALPRAQALWRAERLERSLWGLPTKDSRGNYTAITLDRERMRSLPVAVPAQSWTSAPRSQAIVTTQFSEGLAALRADADFVKADVSVAVYDHVTNRWAVLYDASTRRPLGSMMKVPIALAEERLAELNYTNDSPMRIAERLRRRFMLMRSSNFISNALVSNIGGTSLAENALQESYPGVFSSLTLDERVPDDNSSLDGRTTRNTDSARGVAQWHILLHEGADAPSRAVYSSLGWGYSKLVGRTEIRGYLKQSMPFIGASEVHNKTGTDGLASNDAGTIITADGLEYSIAVMLNRSTRAEGAEYGVWKDQSARAIGEINSLVQNVLRANGYVRKP